MRILQLHCDSIEYTPTKKEIKSAEDIENPQTQRLEELVVVFVAIEDGDDSSVAQNAISQIKESMQKIGCKKLLLYPYAHLSSNLASPGSGLKILKEMESIAKSILKEQSILRLAIVHRIGKLEIGESSILIAVSSGHRAEAFQACRTTIDRVKERVPIWKKEYYVDGEFWVESYSGSSVKSD